jgi:uncharacterized protein YdeI (YjbR/CyaY-like superfamily)
MATFQPDQGLCLPSAGAWRQWLEAHHGTSKGVWLVLTTQAARQPALTYAEALDEALCFGWIDSAPRKRDGESYFQYFSPRKPLSKWSAVNKAKVAALEARGVLHPAGVKAIERAKANGAWDALNLVDARVVPPDLEAALRQAPPAWEHWQAFAPSAQRGILEWISHAKTDTTRLQRVQRTAEAAQRNLRILFDTK